MRVKIDVEYDTSTGRFIINGNSPNIKLNHSGSSYLRVFGDSLEGTIAGLPAWDHIEERVHRAIARKGTDILVIYMNKEPENMLYWGA